MCGVVGVVSSEGAKPQTFLVASFVAALPVM